MLEIDTIASPHGSHRSGLHIYNHKDTEFPRVLNNDVYNRFDDVMDMIPLALAGDLTEEK